MQDRYAGDVGDFVKLALLRALAPGMKLGVAWYLYPDEGHNEDGKHTAYLQQPSRWRSLDEELFDQLKAVIGSGRSVGALEGANVLNAVFSAQPLDHRAESHRLRSATRAAWFESVVDKLR